MSFVPPVAYSGRQYRVIVTDANGNSVISEAATLTLITLTITQQPQDVLALIKANVEFHVEATGSGPLSYQWQTRANAEGKWSNTGFNGNKTDTLSFVPPVTYSGRQYRVIITDANGNSVTSEAATLTIDNMFIVNEITYMIQEDGTLLVKAYSGSSSSVVVPEKVEGMTVTKIGDSAFENNHVLVSIDLPDTITVIGKRAFANCTQLTTMK